MKGLLDYNSPTSNSSPILCETSTIQLQQMAKMNDQVPKERRGTSRFSGNLNQWPHLKISSIRCWLWFNTHSKKNINRFFANYENVYSTIDFLPTNVGSKRMGCTVGFPAILNQRLPQFYNLGRELKCAHTHLTPCIAWEKARVN